MNAVFSGYDANSEFSRWRDSHGENFKLSGELYFVLEQADRWKAASGSAFEPGVQALTDLWTQAAERDQEPGPKELAAALAKLHRPKWRLDEKARSGIRFSSAPITLNAIAKGYIVERACTKALEVGPQVLGVLVNAGGDMTLKGELERNIAIADPDADSESSQPLAVIAAKDVAIAASGRSRARASNPRPMVLAHLRSANRQAGGRRVERDRDSRSGSDADALATILNVLEPAEGLKLVESIGSAECLIVSRREALAKPWMVAVRRSRC